MAPVRGHEVQNTAGDEGKGDGIRASHPLAMLDDLAVACGEEGSGGADHPRRGLHRGAGEPRTSPGESDPRERTDKHGNHVDAAENAMEREMALADPRREIDGADQESEDSGECMRDEEAAVGDDLQAIGVIHGVIGDEENFRRNEDEERSETERNPENRLESRPGRTRRWQRGSWHDFLLDR